MCWNISERRSNLAHDGNPFLRFCCLDMGNTTNQYLLRIIFGFVNQFNERVKVFLAVGLPAGNRY